ncbi:uncharacterized protein LOC130911757 [Corythoichthys intestinalis]|uniref:uncharacterized protein LOC130911756 n=1 Tax=Corythoichthys intestinalis TaxID=161448 RepID=UPI0025A638CC|nr:uncharacterized protein LOC130911756 [Corythoichthys intestinalis]XP_057685282.1 uncharacterized protein LOC130911757 [Corythoichthys intestinalis]
MKRRKEKGGKGVPDLHLFLGSLYVSLHFLNVLGPCSNPKSQAMARFWMGSYLRSLKLLATDQRLPERDPVSPVRGLAIGEPTTVWRHVNHPALPNRLRDLSWMVAHEILPVRTVMHSRGMAAHSTCPRPGCGAPESVRHLLWECSAAADLWATTDNLQFPDLPVREVLNAQLVLFGVSRSRVPKEKFENQWLTLAAIKDAIWTSRNLLVRRNRQIPPAAVLRLAAANMAAAGGKPRTQPQRRIAWAQLDGVVGAPR